MENHIPLIPNEIITEILSYLGRNDLLKCRLVSQLWNELCLKILRTSKYGHEHELTQDNIPKFIEFVKEWVLPLHLNFDCDVNEYTVGCHQIPKYIQQLQVIFGEKCVSGLTLTRYHDPSIEFVEQLLSILTLIAPSLTHLDLSVFRMAYHGEEEMLKVEEMLGNTQLNFPNLSKLKSCPTPILFQGDQSEKNEKNNKIHSFLIEKSQNLKDLEVFSPYGILPIEQIGNLRKLKIVEELYDLVSILEPIRICSVPLLKDLSLFCSSRLSALDQQMLYDFLSSLSTSLQSLMIRFDDVPKSPFPRLSRLKSLTIQVSCPIPTRTRRNLYLEIVNFNSETFPVLESLAITGNVYLEIGDTESGITKGDWSLKTVRNLRIKVMNTSFCANAWDMGRVYHYCRDPDSPNHVGQYENGIISTPSAKDYVDQLQKLFPNVTSLTLVNLNGGGKDEDNEKSLNELLTAFMQSDGAPKIQELEIQAYDRKYMGHILTLNPDRGELRVIIENIDNIDLDEKFLKTNKEAVQGFGGGSDLIVDKQMESKDGVENSVIQCKAPIMNHKMTGLEKIRLSLLELEPKSKQWGWGSEQESNRKDLFLMSLSKYFPRLRQIDISEQMILRDKEFYEQQIMNVQNKCPELIINITR